MGNSTERVAGVSAIVTKHKAPPTAILDAHFVEEQTGDGVLGPSDFRAFYFIEVAPQDVSQWAQVLTPLGATAEYGAPAQLRDWWIARDTFGSLSFTVLRESSGGFSFAIRRRGMPARRSISAIQWVEAGKDRF
jgi:hypothetical protein